MALPRAGGPAAHQGGDGDFPTHLSGGGVGVRSAAGPGEREQPRSEPSMEGTGPPSRLDKRLTLGERLSLWGQGLEITLPGERQSAPSARHVGKEMRGWLLGGAAGMGGSQPVQAGAVQGGQCGWASAESPGRRRFPPHHRPWVIRESPAPGWEEEGAVRYGRRDPKDALSSKPPCAGQARERHLSRYTKINAILYSETFKHQTGNLSSFIVAESRKKPSQIK